VNEERHDRPDRETGATQAAGEDTPIEQGLQQGGTRGSSNQGGPDRAGQPEKDQAVKVGGRQDEGSRSSKGRDEPPQPTSPAETTPEALRGPLPSGASPEDYLGGTKPHKTRARRKTRGASGVKNEVV
jgi:hypothetical protein